MTLSGSIAIFLAIAVLGVFVWLLRNAILHPETLGDEKLECPKCGTKQFYQDNFNEYLFTCRKCGYFDQKGNHIRGE
jgi:ribosomal protein S27AE